MQTIYKNKTGVAITLMVVALLIGTVGLTPAFAYFYMDPGDTSTSTTKAKKAEKKPAKPVLKPFVMQPGLSLKENLLEWGKQAGWQVEWRMEGDIPHIEVQASFGTDFKKAVLAVQQELERQDLRMHVHFWNGDHVVIIRPSVF